MQDQCSVTAVMHESHASRVKEEGRLLRKRSGECWTRMSCWSTAYFPTFCHMLCCNIPIDSTILDNSYLARALLVEP